MPLNYTTYTNGCVSHAKNCASNAKNCASDLDPRKLVSSLHTEMSYNLVELYISD